ncbi:MAG: amidase [Salinarimonas sp.]|nr:amidase [Salinarimonas sp.]
MLSLLDLLRRIDAGQISPQSAVSHCLDLIEAKEYTVRAFTHIDTHAAASTEGPLRGIAVGVKDIIDVAGMVTGMGSPIYRDNVARADAAVTALLRRAGGSPIGKTTTTAFAFLDPTETLNPHNPAHTPGGSSAGSAAAVGAGMLPLSIGTQTGGSVIRPASYCGAAAIKPSFRMLPTVGVKCYSWALDTLGLFAASIPDLAYALAALSERPDLRLPDDRAPDSGGDLRIGVLMQDFAGAPEDDSAAALDAAIKAIEARGASVTPVSAPEALAAAYGVHGVIQDYESARALAWEYDAHRDQLPPILRETLDAAQHVPAAAYDDARRTAHHARREAKGFMREYDALITFASPGSAPEGLAVTGESRFNRLWTLLGVPTVNVPGFRNAAGLPVGVQIVTGFGSDDKALRVAAFVEKALHARL